MTEVTFVNTTGDMVETTYFLCPGISKVINNHTFILRSVSYSERWAKIVIDNIERQIIVDTWFTVDSNLKIKVIDLDPNDIPGGNCINDIKIVASTYSPPVQKWKCVDSTNEICELAADGTYNTKEECQTICKSDGGGNGGDGGGDGGGNGEGTDTYIYLIVGILVVGVILVYYIMRN